MNSDKTENVCIMSQQIGHGAKEEGGKKIQFQFFAIGSCMGSGKMAK